MGTVRAVKTSLDYIRRDIICRRFVINVCDKSAINP